MPATLDVLDQLEDTLTFGMREIHQPSPERRLAVAVLGEVVEDLRRGPGMTFDSQVTYRDAREYVLSDDTTWPYSFVPLCIALDLEPSRMREGLLAMAPGGREALGLRAAVVGMQRRVVASRIAKGRRASWWSGDRVPGRPRRAQGAR